jgi:hypothetical protein
MRSLFCSPLGLILSLALPPLAHAAPTLIADPAHDRASEPSSPARAFQIESAILGQKRQIFVVLPSSFARSASDRRYPVMVVLDGEANVSAAATVGDALAAHGQIPECVIVAIANREGRTDQESARLRVQDLTPPGLSVSGSSANENGDKFLDFIERELLPAVDRQFRGGLPRVLIGHSSGGILATWAAATRPGIRAVIAIDAPNAFGDDWLPKKLIAHANASARSKPPTPLRYASFEARFGWRDDTWRALTAAAPTSWLLDREHLTHESHETMPMLAMYLGLRELFRDYSMLAAPPIAGRVLSYYDSVGTALGASIVPPRSMLQRLTQDLLAEGRGADARDAYRRRVAGYGAPTDSTSLLQQIARVEKTPPPAETVEQLQASSFPTPEQARACIGEWTGYQWMSPEQPRDEPITLRIWIENGRVVGEERNPAAPPDLRVRRFEYLKITPAEITWGFMNGMRPRAMVLFEGVLHGDTLSGAMRFGGIDFKTDDGSAPPPLHFEYVRSK